MNEISTIKRIQDEIVRLLPQYPDGLQLDSLKKSAITQRTRPESKEDWDRQFILGLTGLLIRKKIFWKGRLLRCQI